MKGEGKARDQGRAPRLPSHSGLRRRCRSRGRRAGDARPGGQRDQRREEKGALPRDGARQDLLPGQPVSNEGLREASRADQEKRSSGASRQLGRCAWKPGRRRRRPPHIPAPLGARRRRPCRPRRAAARRRAQGRGRDDRSGAPEGRHPEEHVHPLLRRLHRAGRGRERRVGGPGARLGQPDQPRVALRQGRGHARDRARRPPPALSAQDGRWRPEGWRQWQRISWDTAINEIGDKLLQIREKSGPDSVYWLGSAKFTNEAAYLNRKFAAFWGTNNSDHQARICHSTTVAGVANTWGYGAMTNSYNDIRNAKTMVIMGGNPAEAHPVSLQHVLEGKELNRANMIVIDPRLTRTAAHATEYVRHPLRHRHPGDLGHALAHLQERLGGQGVHPPARLRHGRHPQGGREVDARGGRARLRRARRAARARRQDVRHREAGHADLVHGRHPAHGRHGQRARVLHRAAGHRQRRPVRHRRQHLPRPHQRAGRHRSRPRYRDAAALLRPRRGRLAALVPRVGGRLRRGWSRASTPSPAPTASPSR